MKRYKYIFVIYCIIICSISCKKSFLDVPLTREMVAGDYLKDLTTVNELLNGTYHLLARNFYVGSAVAYADLAADNEKNNGYVVLSPSYNLSMVADAVMGYERNMNSLWLDGYNIIRNINFLLENVDRFRSEDPIYADGIKGQAYALRGLVHFNLVNVFAQPYLYSADGSHPGIPYDTIYAQTQQIIRQSVKEVYGLILSDLQRGLQLMPVSLTSKSIFNPVSVKAFLSRVYLFQGDYQNANKMCNDIFPKIQMMSASNYPAKLFTPADNESLFWFAPASTTLFQGENFSLNRYTATSDLVSTIQEHPNDLRNVWFKDTAGVKQIKKFPEGAVAGISNQKRAYYQTVIRSSEVYLTAAESYAQLGKEDSARYYLDNIRKRADNTVSGSLATGTVLLDSIYKERRKELCFENLRLFDLLRLKKAVLRVDVNSPAPTVLPYPSNKAVAPIPLNDVKVYGLQQNDGY